MYIYIYMESSQFQDLGDGSIRRPQAQTRDQYLTRFSHKASGFPGQSTQELSQLVLFFTWIWFGQSEIAG